MSQLSLFNGSTGWGRALGGMQQSYDAAPDDFKDSALQDLYRTALELQYLTTSDLRTRLSCDLSEVNLSALGHVMMQGKKNGWIENTGTTVRALEPTMHCKHRPLWKSLIYRSNEEAATH